VDPEPSEAPPSDPQPFADAAPAPVSEPIPAPEPDAAAAPPPVEEAPAVASPEPEPEPAPDAGPEPEPAPVVDAAASADARLAAIAALRAGSDPAPASEPAPDAAGVPEPTEEVPSEDLAVVEVTPPAEPEPPAEPPAPGSYRVQGNAIEVFLKSGGSRFEAGVEMDPGRYDIWALFDRSPGAAAIRVGVARIEPGATVTIDCDAAMTLCRAI
jgi:hypothetical protein